MFPSNNSPPDDKAQDFLLYFIDDNIQTKLSKTLSMYLYAFNRECIFKRDAQDKQVAEALQTLCPKIFENISKSNPTSEMSNFPLSQFESCKKKANTYIGTATIKGMTSCRVQSSFSKELF